MYRLLCIINHKTTREKNYAVFCSLVELIYITMNSLEISKLSICPSCDLLLEKQQQCKAGQVTTCPRCDQVLFRGSSLRFSSQLALSLACLVMVILANTYPLLSFTVLGIPNSANILRGTVLLLEHGHYLVGFCVFLASFIAPILLFSLISYTSFSLAIAWKSPGLATALHFQDDLIDWSMIEVYIVSFLVALVKLVDFADIHLGYGLWCICTTLFLSTYLVQRYRAADYWDRYVHIS